ncbi:MAG: DNA mismatch repair protein MutT [Ignavibacteriales bacterium CG12_big_fil_rev_8_21_14_0_65_30_8]|nr:MAG: DNA mismatch repair protein MutT [Ignavibacteriales bacterium CG12_big_fil_rev_8_21_14_0_65_30_8]
MKLATLCYVKDLKNNKTLMLYRNKKENDYHEGKWNGLGGKLEKGESPEECAVRELKEEAGLDVKNPTLKGIITFPDFDGVDDWYVFIFTITEYSGKIIDSPEGKLEWISDDELTSLNLWKGDKIFLEWLNKNKFFSAKFNYVNGKFVDYTVSFY